MYELSAVEACEQDMSQLFSDKVQAQMGKGGLIITPPNEKLLGDRELGLFIISYMIWILEGWPHLRTGLDPKANLETQMKNSVEKKKEKDTISKLCGKG